MWPQKLAPLSAWRPENPAASLVVTWNVQKAGNTVRNRSLRKTGAAEWKIKMGLRAKTCSAFRESGSSRFPDFSTLDHFKENSRMHCGAFEGWEVRGLFKSPFWVFLINLRSAVLLGWKVGGGVVQISVLGYSDKENKDLLLERLIKILDLHLERISTGEKDGRHWELFDCSQGLVILPDVLDSHFSGISLLCFDILRQQSLIVESKWYSWAFSKSSTLRGESGNLTLCVDSSF